MACADAPILPSAHLRTATCFPSTLLAHCKIICRSASRSWFKSLPDSALKSIDSDFVTVALPFEAIASFTNATFDFVELIPIIVGGTFALESRERQPSSCRGQKYSQIVETKLHLAAALPSQTPAPPCPLPLHRLSVDHHNNSICSTFGGCGKGSTPMITQGFGEKP